MTLKYVQSKDGVFIRHIHDVKPTQWDQDNFCFARKLTPEQALHFGVTKLKLVDFPYFDPATQQCEEGPAFLDNGVWTQQYVVTTMSDEESSAKRAEQAYRIREERDRLLVQADWTQGKDIPDNVSGPWAVYRQSLRDVPKQAGFPWAIEWPTQPG